jgi:hypothetical protein
MKALIRFALAAAMLITTLTAQAGWVSGHYRSSGTYYQGSRIRHQRSMPVVTRRVVPPKNLLLPKGHSRYHAQDKRPSWHYILSFQLRLTRR